MKYVGNGQIENEKNIKNWVFILFKSWLIAKKTINC